RLITLHLLVEKDGKLKKKHKAIQNKIDIASEAVQEFHKKMSQIAADEVSKQDVTQREYNSSCYNIKESQIKKAKQRLRDFTQDFIAEFEANSKKSNETYHLNVQLFSLTKNKGSDL